eukprot:TRINITY_DN25650_c0_g1_i1.p1 TRINITY_DN25650_c0_g1~~TRINITY_DN25650_c0_g1_i1.p1  ORF type:complete len:129 (-),score=15.32 TRINITY_DN25650_c0_g1_i1:24-410(-)
MEDVRGLNIVRIPTGSLHKDESVNIWLSDCTLRSEFDALWRWTAKPQTSDRISHIKDLAKNDRKATYWLRSAMDLLDAYPVHQHAALPPKRFETRRQKKRESSGRSELSKRLDAATFDCVSRLSLIHI